MTVSWPLFDLRIRTPRLELRAATDADLEALVAVIKDGVHDPSEMPFLVPWTDLPSPELERSFLRFMWGTRASWSAADWRLPFVVVEGGRAIGVQELRATGFAERRTVETGSWLGRASQGRGLGTEMRAAVLHLAFEGLGAQAATSGAIEGNGASRRVSEKLGYVPNGVAIVAPRGTPLQEHRYLLRRDAWRADDHPATIEGLDACVEMFGVAGSARGVDEERPS